MLKTVLISTGICRCQRFLLLPWRVPFEKFALNHWPKRCRHMKSLHWNIGQKGVIWQLAKSFESGHSIKYSAGVAEPRGKKFHYHLHCSLLQPERDKINSVLKKKIVLFIVLFFGLALFVLMSLRSGSISGLLNQLCLAEIVSVGTKAFSGAEPERKHFFWWSADSWVSSSPSNVLEDSCKNCRKEFWLSESFISAVSSQSFWNARASTSLI